MQDVRKMPDYGIISDELDKAKNKESKKIKSAKNLEEYWIASVGETLYSKMIDKYNKKMWFVDDNKKIDTFNWSPKGVTLKDGPKEHGIPLFLHGYPYSLDGYDKYFPFATADTKVLLNTVCEVIDISKKEVLIKGEKKKYDVIISTIGPDVLLNEVYGPLKYIGKKN